MTGPVSAITPELAAVTDRLAAALRATPAIAAYLRAREELEANQPAGELLAELTSLQADLRVRQAEGTLTREAIEQLRALQRRVEAETPIIQYLATQQAALSLLPDVSRSISDLLGIDFGLLIRRSSC
jgi:cell fate (sporulation/competence/biofilm development) regulator YlbF (YheA/YmcA/DUF963 family)